MTTVMANQTFGSRLRPLICFGIALALSSTVHAASSGGKATPQTNDEFAQLRIRKIAPPEAARDFVLDGIHGNKVSLSSLRGRVVVVNFWATWCPPCRTEMPSMERLYRDLKGSGLALLAVAVKENKKQVADFMRDFGLSFPALLDTDGRVSRSYGTVGLPNTYLIDRKGRLIGHKPGSRDWATASTVEFFRKLLAVADAPESAAEPAVTTLETPPLPPLLYVKGSDVVLHVQQDRSSGTVAKPAQGEKVYPLGKATGGGETWYMVKTQEGAVGWIRLSDLEEQLVAHP